MTTKTLFSTKFTTKPPIFGAGRSKLDHRFITEKYLEIPGIPENPLYIPQPEDLMRGLVLWLNDDGKSASTWKDMTPGGVNNGTVYGAGTPPAATPGALGYSFDGVDDYVDVGNDASLNIITNFTIEFWMKRTGIQTNKYLIQKYNVATQSGVIYGFVANTVEFYSNGFTGTDPRTGSQIVVDDNDWHNIVYSYNGLVFNGYKDGNPIFNKSVVFSLASGLLQFNIGAATSTNYFNGSIDEVRIFNRALSPGEITALFNLNRGKFGV